MAPPKEKAQTLWLFIKRKSVTQTQRNCRRVFEKQYVVVKKFLEKRNVLNRMNSGCFCTSDVEHVKEHNPRRSANSVARELNMAISTLQEVLGKILLYTNSFKALIQTIGLGGWDLQQKCQGG